MLFVQADDAEMDSGAGLPGVAWIFGMGDFLDVALHGQPMHTFLHSPERAEGG